VRVGGGVVDQDIDLAEASDGVGDQLFDLLGLAGVTGKGDGLAAACVDLFGDAGQAVDLARGEDDLGAMAGETLGDGLTDATAGAGDDGNFAGKLEAGVETGVLMRGY
jgi:hypothetical protein